MRPAPQWIKSGYSGSEGGDRVEVAAQPSAVHVGDTENTGPVLAVYPARGRVRQGVGQEA
ncbi:DUF397 domain-containing protein [Streptomyces sp. NPDC050287]|uniref:DUF397 domain-containing protein n=1 Tax=Streptomyces sp. NPDC050287 TaxID=3365608 RepID=UPI0037A5E5EA